MKHNWESISNLSYQCGACGVLDHLAADSDGLVREVERIDARDDCQGSPVKKPAKTRTTTTMKSRKELMVVDEDHGGYLAGHCAVCGDLGWISNIKHKTSCLLRDPGVTHVRMTAVKTKVVLQGQAGRLKWRSPTGLSYSIERRRSLGKGRGTYWILFCAVMAKEYDRGRLSDIRKYIVDNQGVL